MFVKVCGMTSEADALLAAAVDADAVGFIFAPSPRQVAPAVARDIQAFPAGDPADRRAREYGVDAVLLDYPTPGSGKVFDWKLCGEAPPGMRMILAGGLTPDNVGDAVAAVQPWGVDVLTGVEREPGRKDAVKVRQFVAAAKAAEAVPYQPEDDAPYDWEEEL